MVQKNQLKTYKMSFLVSERNSSNGLLVVVTDSGIIGKKFEEKKNSRNQPKSGKEIP